MIAHEPDTFTLAKISKQRGPSKVLNEQHEQQILASEPDSLLLITFEPSETKTLRLLQIIPTVVGRDLSKVI